MKFPCVATCVDRQTDRHAHHNTPLPHGGGEVISK